MPVCVYAVYEFKLQNMRFVFFNEFTNMIILLNKNPLSLMYDTAVQASTILVIKPSKIV